MVVKSFSYSKLAIRYFQPLHCPNKLVRNAGWVAQNLKLQKPTKVQSTVEKTSFSSLCTLCTPLLWMRIASAENCTRNLDMK